MSKFIRTDGWQFVILISEMCLALLGAAAPGLSQSAAGGKTKPDSVAVIILHAYGFEPGTITRPAGKLLLMIHNRSGEPNVTLHVKDAAGRPVHDVPVIKGRHDWQEVVDLPPGRYLLMEDGHSKWTCNITTQ